MDSGLAILGIPITTKDPESVVGDALQAIESRAHPLVMACANPHSLIAARTDQLFRVGLLNAEFVLPDGVGIMWAARSLGNPIAARLTGWMFFWEVMRALEGRETGRVFFLGSRPEVLARIASRMKHDFPHVQLCGQIAPPYGEWDEELDNSYVEQINRHRPDVLWVGMTAPKQERWVEKNRRRLDVGLIGSIGAVFDYYAGTAPLAPSWIRRSGFEWLYRLLRNPRRLWRRTLISGPKFCALVLWQSCFSSRTSSTG